MEAEMFTHSGCIKTSGLVNGVIVYPGLLGVLRFETTTVCRSVGTGTSSLAVASAAGGSSVNDTSC